MTESPFRFADDLGPKSVMHFYEPALGLKSMLVVDNVAAGPAIGGLRMADDVTTSECFRLARAMTYKNAAAGLPHGGAKAAILADPRIDTGTKEQYLRSFARAIEPVTDFIVGPDMGTDETAMGWVKDEIGRAVGLPAEIGGIPLDEIGAAGFGLVVATEVAQSHIGISLEGARVAIQGFGAVGHHAARFFHDKGAVIVAVADSSAALVNPAGFDVAALIAFKQQGRRFVDFEGEDALERDAVISADCDILVPAARPDVIHAGNAASVRAKLVAQGANIGVTEDAERLLHERRVLCIPDFIANAGGVICASIEYFGGTRAQALAVIEEKIRGNTSEVLERASAKAILPRQAAVAMARERIDRAMQLRRWKPSGARGSLIR